MRIEIQNLSKIFENGTHALTDVNLTIENGMFGLLGPNASGKSTLIRILATLMEPSDGTVMIDNLDITKNRGAVRSITGYLPQSFGQFRNITTWEFLDYSARLAGLFNKKKREKEVNETLEALGLYSVRNTDANELSIVKKRHLEIAQAVIGDPKIILMDEPTSGLSPEERIRFRNLLEDRCERVDIIIFSTHILSDISSACKTIAVLESGAVIYHGSPENVLEQVKDREWLLKGAKQLAGK